jgi:hypothetical protein
VCSFLEQDLGIYYLGENSYTHIKKPKDILRIDNRSVLPAFSNRSVFYSNCLQPFYSTRNNLNLIYDRNLRLHEAGENDIIGPSGTHTFAQLVPKEKYYYSKPNLFSDKNNPKRNIHDCVQLCLSQKETFDIALQTILKYLENHPETDYINIAPNDCKNTCTCSECSRINKEEGSSFGTLARFLNKMASALQAKHRQVKIVTLSYLDLAVAPKSTHLDNNVIVRITTDTTTWYHPFNKIRFNSTFKRRVEDWKAMCNNLWVYDYTCDFNDYLYLRPNIDVVADNIRYYKELGFKGVTLESFYENKGVEESELRAFVFSQLVKNPYLDFKKLIAIFCKQYYGKDARKVLVKYYNYLYNRGGFQDFNYIQIGSMYEKKDIDFFIQTIHEVEKLSTSVKEKSRLDRWLLSLKYTLVKDYNDQLLTTDYAKFLRDIEIVFTENKFEKLGSFQNGIEDFIRIHSLKVNYRTRKKEHADAKSVIIDPTKLVINNPTKDPASGPYIIQDDEALNGIAVRYPSVSQDWLVRFEPEKSFCLKNKDKKLTIRVRYEGSIKENSTMVFAFGAYNYRTKERPIDILFDPTKVAATYTDIKLGQVNMEEGIVFYIFPVIGSGIKSIILDSLIFE